MHTEINSSIIDAATELSEILDDSIVIIGGLAVFKHVEKLLNSESLEATRDLDAYISVGGFMELRDLYDVETNQRLRRSQIYVQNIETDIYVENMSRLAVTYPALFEFSQVIDKLRCASLEHLLILKLEAYKDRQNSQHGTKDARDLIRLFVGLNASSINHELLAPYLESETITMLHDICHNTELIQSMVSGNAHLAKQLRTICETVVIDLEAHVRSDTTLSIFRDSSRKL